jgi:transposase
VKLTKSERMELQRQSSARNVRADRARHARLILLVAEGLTWAEIRTKLDCSDSYLSRWSQRFKADRLAGLFARYAGRRRYKVTEPLEARVLAWTTKRNPADGSPHWSSRKLAAEMGGALSHMTIARIWAKHGLRPHRLQGHMASNAPDFGVFIKSSGLALSMNPFRIEIQSPKMEVDGVDIACLIPKATTPDFEALNAAIHTL